MNSKGLRMIVVLLLLCCGLSVYALTEGSTERLELDAAEVYKISYIAKLGERECINIENPAYVEQIVEAVNRLDLRKSKFKLAKAEVTQMSALAIICGDVFSGEPIESVCLVFVPENRVLVNGTETEGYYTADFAALLSLADEIGTETLQEDPYATGGMMIAFPEEMLE